MPTAKHLCCCKWKERCAKAHEEFGLANDPYHRGSTAFQVGWCTKIATKDWKEAFAACVGQTSQAMEQMSDRNSQGVIYIARIHYDPRQLAQMQVNKKFLNTALTAQEMNKFSSVLESQGSFTDKKENVTKYCHYPNYSWDKVDADLVELKGAEQRMAKKIQKLGEMTYEEIQEKIEQDAARCTSLLTQKDKKLQEQSDEINKLKRKLAALVQDNTSLRAERQKLKQSLRRHVSRAAAAASQKIIPVAAVADTFQEKLNNGTILQHVNGLLDKYGMSRLHLFSDEWHENNPHAAMHFFGFRTWQETKSTTKTIFAEELADLELPKRNDVIMQQFGGGGGDGADGGGKKKKKFEKRMNPFEHCLIAKMFMHSIPVRRRLAFMFGVQEQQLGDIIKTWVPRWQNKTGAEQQQSTSLVNNEDDDDDDDDVEKETMPA